MRSRTIALIAFLAHIVGCTEKAPLPPATVTSSSASVRDAPPDAATAAHPAPQDRTVVRLTDAALAKVREFQRATGKPYLRVTVERRGSSSFSYDLQLVDQVHADQDYVDDSHGMPVVVDRESALFLKGTLIDWQARDDGNEGFHFGNPNAVEQ